MMEMRRFSAFLSFVLLLSLGGCGAGSGGNTARAREIAAGITQAYRTGLSATIGGLEVEATLSRTTPASWEIVVNSPDSIAGYTYRMGEDGLEVTYRELTFAPEPDSIIGSAPLLRAAAALSDALLLEPGELPTAREEGWAVERSGGKVPCTLLFDDDSGLPAKLLLDGDKGEILLTDFVFFG